MHNKISTGALIHFRSALKSELTSKMRELLFNRNLILESLNLPKNYLNKELNIKKYRNIIDANKAYMFGLLKYATMCQILNGVVEQGKLDSWVRNISDKTTHTPPFEVLFENDSEFEEFSDGLSEIFKQTYSNIYEKDIESIDDSILVSSNEINDNGKNTEVANIEQRYSDG